VVTNAGEEVLRAGDCAAFAAGDPDAHHLQNWSDTRVRVLEIGWAICTAPLSRCRSPLDRIRLFSQGWNAVLGLPLRRRTPIIGFTSRRLTLVVNVKRRFQFRSARRPTVYQLRLPSWPGGA
jgi:hypothetical protein